MSSASTGGTEGSSPASSPASATSQAMSAPKYGTLVPNRIFVGGISASTSEAELAQLFSAYGNVKATKIISDRAGVSKGYGFVTFETEAEAKRLQQEPESIILRERKLNIAPAIKKQPFNRSFDGSSGSPPAVPTSPYYYANGMGLPYQNGLTFYNTGAPTPGNPLAPPTDPAALYQAASVFGPQAASTHQTFAPMMYPCPAPSLYMPQQYQYSPMPYESYYTGAAGAPQYVYATSNTTNNGNPNGGGGGVAGGGGGGGSSGNNSIAGAASPPSNGAHGLQTITTPHYYTTGTHPAGVQPVPPSATGAQSLDHIYYSFTTGTHQPQHTHQQQHQSNTLQHGTMGIGDQQPLLLFTTDGSCQPASSDAQNQPTEDTRSASSHSDHQSQHRQAQSTGNESNHLSLPSTPLIPIMPIKYPLANRFPYHPHSQHSLSLQPQSSSTQPLCPDSTDDQMHCRILYHPVYIPNPYNPTSLLPTPVIPSSYDSSKRDSHLNKTMTFNRPLTHQNLHIFPQIHHQHQNYNKLNRFSSPLNRINSHKRNYNSFNNTRTSNRSQINSTVSSLTTTTATLTTTVTATTTTATTTTKNHSENRRNSEQTFKKLPNSYSNNSKLNDNDSNESSINDDSKLTTTTTTTTLTTTTTTSSSLSPPPAPYSPMTRPIPNYSPPNLQVFYSQSRYSSNQSHSQSQPQHHHYHHHHHHQQQQQQQNQQRRYGNSQNSSGSIRNKSDNNNKYNAISSSSSAQSVILRNNKYKLNGIMQNNNNSCPAGGNSAGKSSNPDDNLGGAGDAQQTVVNRNNLPLTPPGTPRNLQDSSQISDTCHQIQALTL
ncbi:homeobox protein 5-like [Microplitis mediator]|uniref:homeobox protein 5-like n=1 Tax=Microplitis mediator TaxID=375433 RepID=UPI002557A3B5|nr:homeobox protein 5-like [Microplitis mediator]